jgi:formiminotetrahydrofolate cyclodeaminase
MLTDLSVNDFLDTVASDSPAPGGGSVSALAASLGTALTSMVCRLTIGRKKYADVQREMENVLKRSEAFRAQCAALIDEDTEAFTRVMAAYALPKGTEEERTNRTSEIQEAMKTATLVPLKLMEICCEAMNLVQVVVKKGNQNSLSDAGVAALMLRAGCEGAALNVTINLVSLDDNGFIQETNSKMELLLGSVENTASEIIATIRQ